MHLKRRKNRTKSNEKFVDLKEFVSFVSLDF